MDDLEFKKPFLEVPLRVGWREWLSLPDLQIPCIKAKIDTGARTSTLHAFRVDTYTEHGKTKVRFDIHPRQYSTKKVITCATDLADVRWVTDSGGHKEQRCVILTMAVLGSYRWPIEITLTNRDDMRFRMLLGRTAMRDRFIVEPGASFLQSAHHEAGK